MPPWKSSKGLDGGSKHKEVLKERVDELPLVESSENGDSLTLSVDGDNQKSESPASGCRKIRPHSDSRHVTRVSIRSNGDSQSNDKNPKPHRHSLNIHHRNENKQPPPPPPPPLPPPSSQQTPRHHQRNQKQLHPIISYEKNKSVRIFVTELPEEELQNENKTNLSRFPDTPEANGGWTQGGSCSERPLHVTSWIANQNHTPSKHSDFPALPDKLNDEEGVKVRPLLETSWKSPSHASVLDEPPSSDDCQRSTSTLVNTNSSKINKTTSECQRGCISVLCGIAVVIGSAVCLRLPGLLLTYGAGSFLLAFLVSLVVIAVPLGYLECGLAQFSNNSVIGIWSLVPLFRGIGWSTVVGCLYWGATTVGLAAPWFHYLIAQNEPSILQVPAFCKIQNDTDFDAVNYYRHCVYNLTSNWEDGLNLSLTWSLPAGLIVILIIASISVAGGPVLLAIVSATGSFVAIVGFGAQFYVAFYELSDKGRRNIKYEITQLLSLFIPDPQVLIQPQVWLAAVSQALLCLGSGVGMLLNHSANNVFRHPLKRHLWFLTLLTLLATTIVALTTIIETKIFSDQSFALRSAHRRTEQPHDSLKIYASSSYPSDIKYTIANALVDTESSPRRGNECIILTYRLSDMSCLDVAPGLMKGVPFILSSHLTSVSMKLYPTFLSALLKNLIFLGFLGAGVATSCICMHVGVVAAREARSLPPAVAALILMGVLSLVAAPMSTQAGASLIHLVDNYVLMPGLLWPPVATLIALAACHGMTKVRKDMTFMLESLVSSFWLPVWAFLLPLLLLGVKVWSFYTDWEDLGLVEGPDWRLAIVWSLRIGLFISMPVTAVIVINSQLAYGFKDKVLSSLQSSREWGDWGPQDPIEHHNWRRWREDETRSYASLERRLASKSRPLTYTHSTLSSASSSTIGRLRAKYRGQPQACDL